MSPESIVQTKLPGMEEPLRRPHHLHVLGRPVALLVHGGIPRVKLPGDLRKSTAAAPKCRAQQSPQAVALDVEPLTDISALLEDHLCRV